jgi:predicted site-specific integrase-resolvase
MLINSNDVANRLQISKTTVFKLVQIGKLKPVYVQKQFTLFELSEVERYLLTLNTSNNAK